MNKKNFVWLFVFMLCFSFASATCTYPTGSNSTDYFGVNTAIYNETSMGVDSRWTGWSFFTPRLNFTVPVNDTIVGNSLGGNSTINWKTIVNFSTSLVIKNGSTTISPTNYTLFNISANSWMVQWKVNGYLNQPLNVYFNRTFVKNVDDLVVSPQNIFSSATRGDFLDENSPSDYGDSKLFKFDPTNKGVFINNSNWAVGWTYQSVDCSLGDRGCSAGASNLWAILALIVVAGFLLYMVTVFFEGSVTISIIVYLTIVAFLVPWLISILNGGC